MIFGAGQLAEVVAFYFTRQSEWSVVAHVVDDEYMTSECLNGLPVVPWSESLQKYPPSRYEMFVAMGYSRMNRLRAAKVREVRLAGYEMPSFVSEFARVSDNVQIGFNCLVLEHNTVQPFVAIGNNTFLWSGNHVGHHTVIEDDVFVSSHVVISGSCRIGRGSFLGVNSTVQNGLSVGEEGFVGPSTLVQADLPPKGVLLAERLNVQKVQSSHLRF